VVTLGSNDLVVVLSAQVHSLGLPGRKVSSDIDGSAGAVVLADRPVLLKGRGTVNGRLVGTGGLEDVVGAAINGDRALARRSGGGVI
jgi:hypothetical protein